MSGMGVAVEETSAGLQIKEKQHLKPRRPKYDMIIAHIFLNKTFRVSLTPRIRKPRTSPNDPGVAA